MKGRFQRHLHPGVVAAVILIVFIAVNWVWWRGLVYRPPGGAGGGGGGGGPSPNSPVLIVGRKDVVVGTFSGDVAPGDADGPGHAARFDRPTGIAIDGQGNVYAADTGNHRIRKMLPDSTTTTFAGNESGYQDGPALQARFNSPCGICTAPDGSLYVADTGNHCIRRIFNDQVTTVFGNPAASGVNSHAGGQKLEIPTSIAYLSGPVPALLVSDAGSKKLLKFRLDGGLLSEQSLPGPPTSAAANPSAGVAIPQKGLLLLGASSIHNMPVEDEYAYADPKGPFLRHPVSLCSFGSNWLATDSGHGAVFLVHNGKAGVLAGYASSGPPYRGERDADGSRCEFSTLSGIATDGKKYVFVADTDNNCIRRLTVPDYVK